MKLLKSESMPRNEPAVACPPLLSWATGVLIAVTSTKQEDTFFT